MNTAVFWAKNLTALIGAVIPAYLAGGAVAAMLGGACGATRAFVPCPPTAAGGMSILAVWCIIAIWALAQPTIRRAAALIGIATTVGGVLALIAAWS